MQLHSRLIPILAAAILSCGCTHSHLRYNHIQQAKSLTSIYEQQVLDNLAMFVSNNDAVPFFAVPGGGNARVLDRGSLSASPLNGPARTVLNLTALSRDSSGDWTIIPVNNPDKLRRMRCAYRLAIGMADPGDNCVDCCELEQAFQGRTKGDVSVCHDGCTVRPLKLVNCGKLLYREPCDKVGNYCGNHVRVCPESYADFSQLVLKILDYAIKDPLGHPELTLSVPSAAPPPSAMQDALDNIIQERLKQQRREALFPAF